MQPIMIALSALKPSQYRKYVKAWDKGRYIEAFTTETGKQYRIYIPLVKQQMLKEDHTPYSIVEALKEYGYTVEDYITGIAIDSTGKRRMRIGKLLGKHPELQKEFNNDKNRSAFKGKHMICISRHPYDIAGMSTDRSWPSCMDLEEGSNRGYVMTDVMEGTLIAYVITEDDTNLKKPLSRILIKPYFKDGDQTTKPILVAGVRIYGAAVKGFIKTVQTWCDLHINKHKVSGIYEQHRGLYPDGNEAHVEVGDDVVEVLRIKFDENDKVKDKQHVYRRAVLSKNPELLEKLDLVTVDDIITVANSERSEIAFDVLAHHPERVLTGNTKDVFKKDYKDVDYRQHMTRLVIIDAYLFNKVDALLHFTSAEIAHIVNYNSHVMQYVPVPRIDEFTFNLIVNEVNAYDLDRVIVNAPKGLVPADVEGMVTKYPRLILTVNKPKASDVILAMESSKGEEWRLILLMLKPQKLEYESILSLMDWVVIKHGVKTLIRFACNQLVEQQFDGMKTMSKSNIAELSNHALEYVERVSALHPSIKPYDVSRLTDGICNLMELLNKDQLHERIASGCYVGFFKILRLFRGNFIDADTIEKLAIANPEEGIELSESDLLHLAKFAPKSITIFVDTLCRGNTKELLETIDVSGWSIIDFWKSYFDLVPSDAKENFAKLASRSDYFCKRIGGQELALKEKYWPLLDCYSDKPWFFAKNRWFSYDLNRIPQFIRQKLIEYKATEEDDEFYDDITFMQEGLTRMAANVKEE